MESRLLLTREGDDIKSLAKEANRIESNRIESHWETLLALVSPPLSKDFSTILISPTFAANVTLFVFFPYACLDPRVRRKRFLGYRSVSSHARDIHQVHFVVAMELNLHEREREREKERKSRPWSIGSRRYCTRGKIIHVSGYLTMGEIPPRMRVNDLPAHLAVEYTWLLNHGFGSGCVVTNQAGISTRRQRPDYRIAIAQSRSFLDSSFDSILIHRSPWSGRYFV